MLPSRLKSLEINERKLALDLTNRKRILVQEEGVSEEEAMNILKENRRMRKEEIDFDNELVKDVDGKTKNGNDTENKSSIN